MAALPSGFSGMACHWNGAPEKKRSALPKGGVRRWMRRPATGDCAVFMRRQKQPRAPDKRKRSRIRAFRERCGGCYSFLSPFPEHKPLHIGPELLAGDLARRGSLNGWTMLGWYILAPQPVVDHLYRRTDGASKP